MYQISIKLLLALRLTLNGIINKNNALSFESRIKYLQYALYVGLPSEVENKADKTIDFLINETKITKKLIVSKGFLDNVFEHQLEFSNNLALSFKYVIKFRENK